jgi:MYXO-CTERM domain-containing protein
MTRSLRVLAVLALAAPAVAEDHLYSEADFDPGSWELSTPFWSGPPNGGETMHVTTDRFIGGNPPNGFMLSQFSVEFPQDVSNSVFAPVMLNSFTYDPSTQGEITTFAASMRTLQAVHDQPEHWGFPRMFIEQDGRLYTAENAGNFGGFEFDAPDQVRNFSGYAADNFYELIPNSHRDLDSHPDFGGGPMRFGFGLSLTSIMISGDGPLTIVGAFDDVSVRFSTVPAPGALALLGAGGVCFLRRRRHS